MAEQSTQTSQSHKGRGGRGGGAQRRPQREEKEFEQHVVDLARVTRVTAGGKRMRFRACVAIGDKRGRLGYAIAKGADVQGAIQKAVTRAKKDVFDVPVNAKGTLPHEVMMKFKAAKVFLKPATQGTGVIAGGAVRIVLEIAGVKNVVAKMLGSVNKHNNVQATILALKFLKEAATKKNIKQ